MRAVLAVLVLAMTACAPTGPRELQCTVDDTLSFTAVDVTYVTTEGPVLTAYFADAEPLLRNMLPGETCTRVDKIDWTLAAD